MIKNYALAGFLIISLFVPVDCSGASDTPSDFDSILAVSQKELLNQKNSVSQSPTEVIAKAADFAFWNASFEDLYTNCEKSFKVNGNTFAVRLSFVRGGFDAYSQTYKAEPIVSLRNIDGNRVYPFIRIGQRIDYPWGTGSSSGRIFVEFQPQSVVVTDFYDSAQTVSIPYLELIEKWNAHSSGFCSWYLGRKYCLVPQTFWDGAYHQYGFAVTEGASLYPATGRPQDYVGLFREEPITFAPTYRQIVYSLALRLAFVLSPNLKNTWELRPMTAVEVGEVMVDRISAVTLPIGTSTTLIASGSVSH